MDHPNPPSRASLFGHPLHPMLVPFPMVGFIGALLSDLAYYGSTNLLYLNMSSWLLLGGLIGGTLAAIAGLIDFSHRQVRALTPAWLHMGLNLFVMVLETFNLLIHFRDGYTAVVPTGLTLSILSVLILGVSGWLGGALVYKHRVGVRP